MKYCLIMIMIALLTTGCQSFFPPKKLAVPSVHRHYFGSCPQAEGGLSFSARLGEQEAVSAFLDWVYSENTWRWEFSDTLGRTLLSASLQGKRWVVSGKLARHSKAFSLSQNGQIRFRSHNLLLKFKELLCLSNLRFPDEWMEYAVGVETQEEKETIQFQDQDRFWRIDFPAEGQVCGTMGTWTLGLFRNEQVHWCLEGPKGSLKFAETVKLEWRI
ncbi:MAG: hypothetical protein HYW48_07750 [Deltaproteobacteria bacterium]|nr:hypothetical protein [Deltaproteobacteria bacterium]